MLEKLVVRLDLWEKRTHPGFTRMYPSVVVGFQDLGTRQKTTDWQGVLVENGMAGAMEPLDVLFVEAAHARGRAHKNMLDSCGMRLSGMGWGVAG